MTLRPLSDAGGEEAPAGEASAASAPGVPGGTIRSALERHAPRLLALPGVAGVAEGESGGRSCIVVYVAAPVGEATAAALPAELDGWPVVVRESGEFRALFE